MYENTNSVTIYDRVALDMESLHRNPRSCQRYYRKKQHHTTLHRQLHGEQDDWNELDSSAETSQLLDVSLCAVAPRSIVCILPPDELIDESGQSSHSQDGAESETSEAYGSLSDAGIRSLSPYVTSCGDPSFDFLFSPSPWADPCVVPCVPSLAPPCGAICYLSTIYEAPISAGHEEIFSAYRTESGYAFMFDVVPQAWTQRRGGLKYSTVRLRSSHTSLRW